MEVEMKLAPLLLIIVSLLFSETALSGTFTSSTSKEAIAGAEGVTAVAAISKTGSAALDNWTATTNAAMLASPKLADLTGDGVDEILLTTYGIVNPYGEGWLRAWDGSGNELTGYPVHLTGAPPGSPAIGDLDGDGDPEIVQGTWNYLYVFNADGTNYPGWPQANYVTQSAALADLDGNGDLEIIVPVSSSMKVLNHNGTTFPGFPVSAVHDLTAPSVGDLDGDGDLEIVAGSFVASGSPSDYVYAWHHDGTSVAGFPVTTSGSVKAPPALADLDNDGSLEIIADCWVTSGTDFLYGWDNTGNSMPGWPLNVPYIRLSSPSVADLDLDGDLEIIVGGWSTSPSGEKIHAYHRDASIVAGFPVVLLNSPSGNVNSTPTTGDIDGDGYPEIVVKGVNNIFALNHDGSTVSGFPIFLSDENHSGTTSPTPALGDPDGDGLVEIFAASCYNNVMLIDQSGAYSVADMYWPTYRRDPHNTGTYAPESGFPNVTVTLTPYGAPIVIPASGGSFDYNIAIANGEISPQNFDVWIMVTLPTGGTYYLLGPVNMTLPGNRSVNRDRTQIVPGSAPAGEYIYWALVGNYPDEVWDSDSFAFTKSTTDDGSPWQENWLLTGEPFEDDTGIAVQPADVLLIRNYPNPFNPTTIIRFDLPQSGWVKLEVFDLAGRNVGARHASPLRSGSVDGWLEAGSHQVTFDGSELPSGVYVYRLQAGELHSRGKMVLIK